MSDKVTRRGFLDRLKSAPVIVPAAVGITTSALWGGGADAASPGLYDFWVHGTSVQVENPELTSPGYVWRQGFATRVRQAPGTANWFHFAIPTPTIFNNMKPMHRSVYLRVWMSLGVLIDEVHVYDGDDSFYGYAGPPFVGNGATQFIPLNIPDGPMIYGLGISVHVRWMVGGDEIRFISAGGGFEI
jgi:hypothetical protein